MKKSTQEDSRQHNSRLVLRTIYERQEISRVDISRLTGLTRTTVSEIAGRFIESGLVEEVGAAPSRGGKPAILLRVADDARHVIGIDLANNEFRGAIVNLRGQVLQRLSLPVHERDGEAALALVYNLVEQLLADAERPLLGVGIGAPGLMDPHQGMVRQAVNLDWHNLPLAELLHERFGLPIYIANDSQAAALGEFTFANPERLTSMIVIQAGRGVSAGIVIDGQILHGDNAGAGEIGHVCIAEDGERCRCGNRGCLETFISSRALRQRARQAAARQPGSLLNRLAAAPEALTIDDLLQAYQDGDPAAQTVIAEAGRTMAIAVTHLASVLNINHIVLAGSLARFGEGVAEPVRQRLAHGILPALARQTHFELSALGGDIVILGAASLLLNQELGLA